VINLFKFAVFALAVYTIVWGLREIVRLRRVQRELDARLRERGIEL
jgi:hypothetical protein